MEVEENHRKPEKHQSSIKSRFKRVCVFCGSSPGKYHSYQVGAIQLGKQLVERKIDSVYGAGSISLMEQMSCSKQIEMSNMKKNYSYEMKMVHLLFNEDTITTQQMSDEFKKSFN